MATMRSGDDLEDADLKGKKVLVRADLNVPFDDNFNITDDTKIRAAVPTIEYLMAHGAKVILSSHLGCPKGVTPKYSLKPLVPRLSELLGVEVKMANDCIGAEVEKMVAEIPRGGVLLLENVRFHKEEEKNDPEFAKKLASLADLYVNDAIGTAAHASTEGVAKYFKPCIAGFLMEKVKMENDWFDAVRFHREAFAGMNDGFGIGTGYRNAYRAYEPFARKFSVQKGVDKASVAAASPIPRGLVEKAVRKEVFAHHQAQGKRQRCEESSQLEISSLDDDLEGVQPQLPQISFSNKDLKGEPPHKGPLVITLKVGNFLVDKIIVNTGSSCNIIYWYTFKKFNFKEDLRPRPLNEREASSNGQVEQPKGVVTLPVHAGSKTVYTQFLVIDAPSTYNVILGRSWIHEMKAVVSTYHRLLKFPNKDSTAIEDIRGEAFDSTKTVFWNGPVGM